MLPPVIPALLAFVTAFFRSQASLHHGGAHWLYLSNTTNQWRQQR
jgi:hypothetical protein